MQRKTDQVRAESPTEKMLVVANLLQKVNG